MFVNLGFKIERTLKIIIIKELKRMKVRCPEAHVNRAGLAKELEVMRLSVDLHTGKAGPEANRTTLPSSRCDRQASPGRSAQLRGCGGGAREVPGSLGAQLEPGRVTFFLCAA